MSPNIQGQEDTVNHICLGCWPGEFLFPSIVGNAASPNHPSTPKTSQQKIVSPQVKSRSPAKMSGVLWVVGFCFFLFFFSCKRLRIFSREPSWCGARKLLATFQFLAMQGEPGQGGRNTCPGQGTSRAADHEGRL